MFTTNLFSDSESRKFVARKENFSVIEYERDISIAPGDAQLAFFESKMNVRKRQLVIELSEERGGVYAQAGDMQMIMGDIEASTGIKGAGDLLKKFVGSAATSESVIKPYYTGTGLLILEPTYRFIIMTDIDDWPEGMVIEDRMFLAAEESVRMELTARKNLSSAILGGEGLINTLLTGSGIAALESPVPQDELIEVELKNDMLKVDGNMAVAWSPGLDFSVQKSTSTLVGSFVSGEGFVNVYEGNGRVLIAPVRSNPGIAVPVK